MQVGDTFSLILELLPPDSPTWTEAMALLSLSKGKEEKGTEEDQGLSSLAVAEVGAWVLSPSWIHGKWEMN